VRIAAGVLRQLADNRGFGVRLDSGDLGELAQYARRTLDAAGLTTARIVVRGGLDEYGVDALIAVDAPVDLFAVGTKVGTSADAPYLNSAYKLVEYAGRPVMKMSPEKTRPHRSRSSAVPAAPTSWRSATRTASRAAEPPLEQVMVDGQRASHRPAGQAHARDIQPAETRHRGSARCPEQGRWPQPPAT
jgi:nicotinate phosphoribosyltransferase